MRGRHNWTVLKLWTLVPFLPSRLFYQFYLTYFCILCFLIISINVLFFCFSLSFGLFLIWRSSLLILPITKPAPFFFFFFTHKLVISHSRPSDLVSWAFNWFLDNYLVNYTPRRQIANKYWYELFKPYVWLWLLHQPSQGEMSKLENRWGGLGSTKNTKTWIHNCSSKAEFLLGERKVNHGNGFRSTQCYCYIESSAR